MSGNRIIQPGPFMGPSGSLYLSYPGGAAPEFIPSGSPVAWYKSDSLSQGDGTTVAQWNDSTGNGNHLLQGVGLEKPTFQLNQQNSLPALRFDGVNDSMQGVFSWGPGTANFNITVFVVFRAISWNVLDVLFDGAGADNELRFIQHAASPDLHIGGGQIMIVPQLAIGTWGIMSMNLNGADEVGGSEVKLAGAGTTTGTTNTFADYSGFTVGSVASQVSNWANFDIGEILLYDTEISIAANEAGLMTKWGIT